MTVADRPATMGDQATMVERIGGVSGGTMAGSEATVLEAVGVPRGTVADTGAGSAATVVEAKQSWGGAAAAATAQPTVLERKLAPGETPKSKMPLILGALVAVIVIAIAAVYFLRKPAAVTPGTTTSMVSIPVGQGVLLLTSPFGEKATIESLDTNKTVSLADNTLPMRVELAPGKYKVTFQDSDGRSWSEEVTITAAQEQKLAPKQQKVNLDQVVEEVMNQ